MKIESRIFDDNNRIHVQTNQSEQGKKASGAAKKADGRNVDGSFLKEKLDPIAAKKEEAKKRAMNIIGNAFSSDWQIDNDLQKRQETIASYQKERAGANREIGAIEERREGLKEIYGISEDSQEAKDLALLEKEVRANMPGSGVTLTKEETEQIAQIKENGLSEYQSRSLDMLAGEMPYAQTVYEANMQIEMENRVISATKLERLKHHTMADAVKQADEVMKESSREITGMLVDEAKDHVDEQQEETEEKAKAEKEKQEAIKEQVDRTRDKKKENEELTEHILEGTEQVANIESELDDAQQEIKDMMQKMKLVEEDIKGAAVDETV